MMMMTVATRQYLVKCKSRILAVYNSEFIPEEHMRQLRKTCSSVHGIIRKDLEWVYSTKTSDVDKLKRHINSVIRVTRLLNVLSASGVSVYTLVFVLEADILSTCCNNDDAMWHVRLFWETITASRVCCCLVNHSNVDLRHSYYVDGSIRHFELPKG